MRYRPLGRTGQFVSEICLGTMTFAGGAGMWRAIGAVDQKGATALVERALAAGVNFVDTADVYSEGQSEVMLGQALRDLKVGREDVIVATKVRGRTGAGVEFRRPVARPRHGSDRRQPEAARARLRRPLSDPRLRSGHADRGNVARARRLRVARACADDRLLQSRRLADHEGAGDFRAARLRPLRDGAGLLHHRRPRSRARDRAAGRGPGARRDGVEPARRRPAERQVRARRQGAGGRAPRRVRLPAGRQATAPSPSSTRCGRSPRRTARRWRASRSPGCCGARA